MIRKYPALSEKYKDLHEQSVTANYSGMPRGGDVSRSVEEIAVRELPFTEQREYEAVRLAISQTERYKNGRERLRVIRLAYWDGCEKTLDEVAAATHFGVATIWRYHGAFIKLVAKNYGLMDEIDSTEPK